MRWFNRILIRMKPGNVVHGKDEEDKQMNDHFYYMVAVLQNKLSEYEEQTPHQVPFIVENSRRACG